MRESLLVNLGKAVPQKMGGRDYLVAPLTLIVPGVLTGSQGPIYYPPEEVERWPGLWNHVPLVVYHPVENGQHVTARDPSVLDKSGIGLVLRDKYENDKRSAEAWFEVEATKRVDSTLPSSIRILPRLLSGAPIEISTGLDLDKEIAPVGATHNETPYESIARNFRPDHLAILPDARGACSNKDGCGVNVNAENCGGEGGTPGPCASGDKSSKGEGKKQDVSSLHSAYESSATMSQAEFDEAVKGIESLSKADLVSLASKMEFRHPVGMSGKNLTSKLQQRMTLRRGATQRAGLLDRPGKDSTSNEGETQPLSINEIFEIHLALNCGGEGGTPGPCKVEGGEKPAAESFKSSEEIRTAGDEAMKSVKAVEDKYSFKQQVTGKTKDTFQKELSAEIDKHMPRFAEAAKNGKTKELRKAAQAVVERLGMAFRVHNKETSNEGETMKRSEMISHLTANCECWKGKEDKAVLEKMKDDQLQKLVNQSKIILVVNQIKNKKSANADDEAVAGVPWTELAVLLGVDLNPADDPIAFAAALKSKVDEISSKLGGTPAAEEEIVPEVTMSATEEDQVAAAAGTQEVPKTTLNRRKVSGNLQKPLSSAEWLKGAPPEVRSAVTNAMNLEKQAKTKLVQRLVGNIADAPKRQAIGVKLMSKSLDELQELASLIPEAPIRDQDTPNFAFAGGAGVGQGISLANEGGEDDSDNTLPIFAVNFEEMASPKLRQKTA